VRNARFLALVAGRGLVKFLLILIVAPCFFTGATMVVLSISNGGVERGLIGLALMSVWWFGFYAKFLYDRAVMRNVPTGMNFTMKS
jgi:ascorbate-specific PTS system EIIC-type component UlaA